MADSKLEEPKFFEHGGGRFFVSVTTARSREVSYLEGTHCVLLKEWEDVIKHLQGLTQKIRFEFSLVSVEIFTRPRLCNECYKHATQPVMFNEAKYITECLCWIEKTPCGVHK